MTFIGYLSASGATRDEMRRGYVPSAWDLPWQERAAINQMYAEMAQEMAMCQDCEPTMVEMVKEFHDKFGIVHDPNFEQPANTALRLDLIEEEFSELTDEVYWQSGDIDKAKVADALGDILYVTIGAAESWGIDIERVFAEIHRSNMTKEGGGKRADGKILKGPNYSPPDLSFVLEG